MNPIYCLEVVSFCLIFCLKKVCNIRFHDSEKALLYAGSKFLQNRLPEALLILSDYNKKAEKFDESPSQKKSSSDLQQDLLDLKVRCAFLSVFSSRISNCFFFLCRFDITCFPSSIA